ncbi:class A beta-lactamase-related serine hydrolase [Streptomyces sp. NBC_01476]|uniref:serine hydrolase n=1 Tax=Streptomyces sp. NBC_01476 TaxID=2903881 RepID=UPI002E34911D|nr:serine hydrolase [Streptomyces sp. NBC_01476]
MSQERSPDTSADGGDSGDSEGGTAPPDGITTPDRLVPPDGITTPDRLVPPDGITTPDRLVPSADDDAQTPGSDGRERLWSRQMVLSVSALAVMAALTLTTIVQSPAHSSTPGPGTEDAKPAAELTQAARAPAPAAESPVSSPAPSRTPATTPPPATTPAAPSPSPSATTADPRTSLSRAVKDLGGSGTMSVGVADLDGTASATYDSDRDDRAYDTASIVKVDILATLLLRHQRRGTSLSAGERNLATSMIEVSDNDAAEELWETIGGASGLAAGNATLGLHHTVGGPGDLWGLTQTTAVDQLALLRAVFGSSGSPLSAASRSYVKSLMTSVSAGQRWGVSAADSDGAGFALKNGWLQRTATGLWDINSIGLVTYHGHRLLICVLSSGQRSEQKGIDLVEDAASAAATSFVAGLS